MRSPKTPSIFKYLPHRTGTAPTNRLELERMPWRLMAGNPCQDGQGSGTHGLSLLCFSQVDGWMETSIIPGTTMTYPSSRKHLILLPNFLVTIVFWATQDPRCHVPHSLTLTHIPHHSALGFLQSAVHDRQPLGVGHRANTSVRRLCDPPVVGDLKPKSPYVIRSYCIVI